MIFLALFLSVSLGAAELDAAAKAVAGKEASFTQKFTPRGFKQAQVETGTVVFGALPMMRWAYRTPEEKLFVFDGSRSWFYVPGDRQVTVGKLDEARKKELPFLLLGDAAARSRHFQLREQRKGDQILTTLAPKDRKSLVRDVTITTNRAHLVTKIEYSDREGNRTVFELSGYHPRAAGPELFRFAPPPGTQVVGE